MYRVKSEGIHLVPSTCQRGTDHYVRGVFSFAGIEVIDINLATTDY